MRLLNQKKQEWRRGMNHGEYGDYGEVESTAFSPMLPVVKLSQSFRSDSGKATALSVE